MLLHTDRVTHQDGKRTTAPPQAAVTNEKVPGMILRNNPRREVSQRIKFLQADNQLEMTEPWQTTASP